MKLLFTLLAMTAIVQAEISVCGTEELLPIGFTDEELTRLDEIGVNTISTSPPPVGTINPGEYDPATGIMVRWPLGLPWELLISISSNTELWVICTSAQQSTAEAALSGAGCNMANVGFINAETNSIWVRDYGPWFVMLPDGSQGIFNYSYNRPRPLDNNFPVVIGAEWSIPVYTSTVIHTGGNYMSSGLGQSMSTDMVYLENGGDEAWVNGQMEDYLGVSPYLTYADPQATYIDHIDCWAKMLSPDRILILQVPISNPNYAAIEAVADLIGSTPSPYGTPWKVYRVPSSGNEGYTNSLISDGHVYLPVWDSSYDSGAFAVYEEALPGYTIEAFPYSGWLTTDALHCRTRNVMDNEMLLIEHTPVDPLQHAGVPVTVAARIRCNPANSLAVTEVAHRSGGSGPFTSLSMTSTGADSFTADIPGLPDGEQVEYYIRATDDSGRDEARPRYAPNTWFFEYETSSTGIGGSTPFEGFTILQAAPNPFSGAVSIGYLSDSPRTVALTVHDVCGRIVESHTLEAEAGAGSLEWTADEALPPGIYVIRGVSGDITSQRTVTLIR